MLRKGMLGLILAGTSAGLVKTAQHPQWFHDKLTRTPAVAEKSIFQENNSHSTSVRKNLSSSKFIAPLEAPSIELPDGDWCARYARLAAEKLYGIKFKPADAWNVASVNKSVWKYNHDKSDYREILQPGMMLGVYNPRSLRNLLGRPYTHVALFVGYDGNVPIVIHRVNNKNYRESISSLENRIGPVREVMGGIN